MTGVKGRFSIPLLLIVFFVVLTLSGVLLGFAVSAIYGRFSFRLIRAAVINSLFLSIGVIITFIVNGLLYKQIPPLALFFIAIAMVVGMTVVGTIIVLIVDPYIIMFGLKLIGSFIFINAVFIITISVIASGIQFFQFQVREYETRMENERAKRRIVELKMESARLEPHFLFNSINTIASLVEPESNAEEAILLLSNILRYTLDSVKEERVDSKRECEACENYLQFQRIRYGERLTYSVECKESCMIPPLVLQPLIENSIKHVLRHSKNVYILCRVNREDKDCVIRVEDSGRALQEEMVGRGVGLQTTRERIEAAGGSFEIKNGGVSMRIPL